MGDLIWSRPRQERDLQKRKGSTRGKFMGKSVLVGLHGREPYMTRYFVGGFRLHIMHRGDAGRGPHDHPWWFITFPLNSYVEEVAYEHWNEDEHRMELRTRINLVKRFRFYFRPARYTHRILGPLDPVYRVLRECKLSHKDAWLALIYKPGVSLDEIDAQLDRMEIPKDKRTIRTLVMRGRVRNAWGFFLTKPPNDWMHHLDYFQLHEYDQ